MLPPAVRPVEIVACQSDATEMVDASVFPISRCGQRNARRAPLPVRHDLDFNILAVSSSQHGLNVRLHGPVEHPSSVSPETTAA
jgi:hypothetical protein